MEQETTKRGLLELRQVIRDQIAKAEKELAAIDLLLSNWFDSEPDAPPSEPDAPPSEPDAPPSESGAPQSEPGAPQGRRRGRRRASLQDRVQDSAYQILSRGPMKRNLLTEMVIKSGVEMKAQRPAKQVGKILAMDPRFRNNGGGIWSLAATEPESQKFEQTYIEFDR